MQLIMPHCLPREVCRASVEMVFPANFQSVVGESLYVEAADTEGPLCCLRWPESSLFSVTKCSEPPLSGVCLIPSQSRCVSEEGTQREEHPHGGRVLLTLGDLGCNVEGTEHSVEAWPGLSFPCPG